MIQNVIKCLLSSEITFDKAAFENYLFFCLDYTQLLISISTNIGVAASQNII